MDRLGNSSKKLLMSRTRRLMADAGVQAVVVTVVNVVGDAELRVCPIGKTGYSRGVNTSVLRGGPATFGVI